MTINKLVKELKDNKEDFEFYPTTPAMIDAVINDIREKSYNRNCTKLSVLEIGAGDCRVSKALLAADDIRINEVMVVEKAVIHIKNLPDDFILVGTEFFETNLASVDANIVFCNPPYSLFELWVSHILNTSHANVIYMIIPERWQISAEISQIIGTRSINTKVIGSFDFKYADRTARGTVNVVRFLRCEALLPPINLSQYDERSKRHLSSRIGREYSIGFECDPLSDMFKDFDKDDEQLEDTELPKDLFLKGGTVDDMVAFYNKDLERLHRDFTAISQISPKLFKMLGVGRELLTSTVKKDIKQLKYIYWEQFLNCYEPIISRLTKSSRDSFYSKVLTNARRIDFTTSNCYAMTVLAIERANQYADKQIKHLFMTHAKEENLTQYKSNQRVFKKGEYRYTQFEERAKYFERCKLEFRMICSYHYSNNLFGVDNNESKMRDIINDYVVVARTLNFGVNDYLTEGDFKTGCKIHVYYHCKGEKLELMDITFYKKGTYHVRLSREFALRLNIAIAKLYGWLHTPEQASEELNENLSDVVSVFNSNNRLDFNTVSLLGITFKPAA